MKFTKMHGIGNDYIYVFTEEEKVSDPEHTAIKVSDRHKGIGSDGLILIGKDSDGFFTMDIYNADGSRGKMCGNGIRCVGKYLYDRGLTGGNMEVDIKTLSGIKHLKLICEGGKCVAATVDMGRPVFDLEQIPADPFFLKDGQLTAGCDVFDVFPVSMGNPHCVIFADREPVGLATLDRLDIGMIGPLFEKHSAFPEGVNTEFVIVEDNHTISMRVWERGSGETLACGTGACAAAVASIKTGRTEAGNVKVKLLGGDLDIFWDGGNVLMTGPCATVCEGEYFAD
ncbi:MAG: diaminopimelate epimerase [Clostridia bacterium]|nr:diaminopimelate epimerase [Clostridia bacterium]